MNARELFTAQENQEQTKQIVLDLLTSHRMLSFARVEEYDSKTHSVRCRLLPQLGPDADQTSGITGWLPLLTPWMGTGWGAQFAPIPGEMYCLVISLGTVGGGGMNTGAHFAIGGFYNTTQVPPGAPAGEMWIFHKSGTKVQLKNNGDVIIDATGNIRVFSGDVEVGDKNGEFMKLVMENFMEIYNAHIHDGAVGKITNPPTAPGRMTTAQLTSHLKAD